MKWWKLGLLSLGLTTLTFLCVAVLLWQGLQRLPEAPAPSAEGTTPAPAGRIAFLGADGNIWTSAPDGSDTVSLTTDAQPGTRLYHYPTWSPDGDTLAFVEQAQTEGDSALHFVSRSNDERTRIATEFTPFYLFWSPTSESLAFLSSWRSNALALRMVDVVGQADEATTVSEGQPFYFSWDPAGQRMFAHIGRAELAFLDRSGRREPLDVEGGLFQAPHWSADGQRLAFVAAAEEGEGILSVTDASGQNMVEVTRQSKPLTFNWSPDNQRLAYSFMEQQVPLAAYGPLFVQDVDANRAWELSREPVMAFFWSPDGKSVAFLRPEFDDPDGDRSPQAAPLRQQSTLWLRWHVWNGERTYPLARFSPSEKFLVDYLRYFDQYAQSVSLWSPDSQTLLYAGMSDDGSEGIWTLPIAEGSAPRRIARGSLAAWSPR